MNLTYQNNTLYIDLIGDIDIKNITEKVNRISDSYNIDNLVINTDEAFISEYKKIKLKEMVDRG